MITRAEIVTALTKAGVEPGMTVFSHANIAFFGRVQGAETMDSLTDLMLDCFADALGPDGTLVLPVFTYSFGSDKENKVFDLQSSLSTTGAMGNRLLTRGAGARSADPMLSVVATGAGAHALTTDIGPACFGPDSIWARLHAADALICNLNLDSGSTFLHWVEREARVPYRSDISMRGTIVDAGRAREAEVIYSGRDLTRPEAAPRFEAYHSASLAHDISRRVPLGRGQIVAQRARAARTLLETLWDSQPMILTAAHDADRAR